MSGNDGFRISLKPQPLIENIDGVAVRSEPLRDDERQETPFRRGHIRSMIDRVQVDNEIRIMAGRALWNASAVSSFVRKWRATADEDGNYCFAVAL